MKYEVLLEIRICSLQTFQIDDHLNVDDSEILIYFSGLILVLNKLNLKFNKINVLSINFNKKIFLQKFKAIKKKFLV